MHAELIEFAGVSVFAVSGALAAARKNLDLLGVVVVATVTAIGGGTIRDVLLNRDVFWILRPVYLYVILGAALATLVYTRRFQPPERALAIADAFGLAFFSLSGAQIAEMQGHSDVVAVVMGALTGVAGGVLRDILSTEIPLILRKGQIYATAAIVGVVVYLALEPYIDRNVAAYVGMFSIAALRLGAIAWNWTLPVFSLPHEENPRMNHEGREGHEEKQD